MQRLYELRRQPNETDDRESHRPYIHTLLALRECGQGRGIGPAARTRGKKRVTEVEEEEDIAEGNNNAHEEQELDIQQLMEELTRNQEAEVAFRAQIATQEQKQQQGV